MRTVRYAIIIEKGDTSYSACAPDLPGCIAAADTLDETVQLMREAIEFHIEGLLRDGDSVPQPTTACDYVEVQSVR